MTGKVLGPVGLTALLISGTWPLATIVICLTNDIIWWIPFGQYLRDARPAGLVHRKATESSHRTSGPANAAAA